MASDLYGQIARILQTMTHRELSEAPQQIAGLVVANGEGLSKRERIDLALANLTQAELARFALKFAAHRGDVALDELGRRVLEAGDQPCPTSHDETSLGRSEMISLVNVAR